GELEFLLDSGEMDTVRDSPVLLPVQPNEDVALGQVCLIEIPWGMWAGPDLEHHRREAQGRDGPGNRTPLVRQLAKCRTDEHPETLVGSSDGHTRQPPRIL